MKIKSKALFLVLTGIVLVYAGCKKSSTAPAVVTTPPQVVASELAVNLNQSLSGEFGGFDVFQGLDGASSFGLHNAGGGLSAPLSFSLRANKSLFTVHTRAKQVLSVTNPECGLVVDTTVNEKITQGNFSLTVAGEIKFIFNCTNNVVSGFNNIDNLSIALTSADTSFTYKVGENVTMAAVKPSDPNSNVSLNGTVSSDVTYSIKSGAAKGSGTASFSYTFTNIIISPTAGGVVSGTATFNTTASGAQGTWNYQGSITFLGNGSAKIVISGVTYTVNLDTGATS